MTFALRGGVVIALSALVSCLCAETANAATAFLDSQGTTLSYWADGGEINTVTVNAADTAYVISDSTATITPGNGCISSDAHTVTCTLPTDVVYLKLRDQDDSLLIEATAGDVQARGMDGADALSGASASGRVDMSGDRGRDTLLGSPFADTLNGGPGADVVRGGDGDDEIQDQDGKDRLYGGKGDDFLGGGHDSDTISGGSGDDYIVGDRGSDTIRAGAGADYVTGGYGVDYIWGSDGGDEIWGGRQIVGYNGGPVYDSLHDAGDWLYGEDGNDTLHGGGGFDHLFGGHNVDRCTLDSDGGVRRGCE